jgi:hypothetical protein
MGTEYCSCRCRTSRRPGATRGSCSWRCLQRAGSGKSNCQVRIVNIRSGQSRHFLHRCEAVAAPLRRDQRNKRTGLVRLPADPSCAAPADLRLNSTESRCASRLNGSFATHSGVKQTSQIHGAMSSNDPLQTSITPLRSRARSIAGKDGGEPKRPQSRLASRKAL